METTPTPQAERVNENVPSSQEAAVDEAPKTGFWGFMSKVVGVMDYVGETVVGILGLDDSKFQYVMDGMDKEDWQKAVDIDRERRLEDAIMDAAEELKAQDTQLQSEDGGDMEGGGEVEERKIKEYMNLVRDQVTADFWEKEIQENPELEREIRQVVPDDIEPIVRAEDVKVQMEAETTIPSSNMSIETPPQSTAAY